MISGGQSSIIGLGGGNKKPNKLFKPNPSGVGTTLLTYKQQQREKDLQSLDHDSLLKLLKDTQDQIHSYTVDYEKKVKEKTSIVTKHKQYYGNKCHELLYEMLSK